MTAPINGTTVFDELAASVLGIVTKKAFTQFDKKTEIEKTIIISKTIAAAVAAGFLGSVLTPSGTAVFIITGVLSFSHFVNTVSIADQAVKSVRQHLSLFNEMADSALDIIYGGAFRRFLAISTIQEQALITAKVTAVAAAVGLIGSVLGFAGTSLFLISTPFTFAHFTRHCDEVAPEESAAVIVEQSAPEESIPAPADQPS